MEENLIATNRTGNPQEDFSENLKNKDRSTSGQGR